MRGSKRFPYSRPRSMTHALASVPIMAAFFFACMGWELMAWLSPDIQFVGVIMGFFGGMIVAFLGIQRYIEHSEKQTSANEASEDGM